MKMTDDELKDILKKHAMWLAGEEGGQRADLSGADLSGAKLYGTDIRGADFYMADLSGANLGGANLCRANLRGANLCKANLGVTDLHEADLSEADLSEADLSEANLYRANLYETYLVEANLNGADIYRADFYMADLSGAKNVPYIPMSCPETGRFIGWKAAAYFSTWRPRSSRCIVKLEIPANARRSSATGRKCRCDKAKVLALYSIREDGSIQKITDRDMAYSYFNHKFTYRVGEMVSVPNFDEDRFNECAPGIHFFINVQEAIDYNV